MVSEVIDLTGSAEERNASYRVQTLLRDFYVTTAADASDDWAVIAL